MDASLCAQLFLLALLCGLWSVSLPPRLFPLAFPCSKFQSISPLPWDPTKGRPYQFSWLVLGPPRTPHSCLSTA